MKREDGSSAGEAQVGCEDAVGVRQVGEDEVGGFDLVHTGAREAAVWDEEGRPVCPVDAGDAVGIALSQNEGSGIAEQVETGAGRSRFESAQDREGDDEVSQGAGADEEDAVEGHGRSEGFGLTGEGEEDILGTPEQLPELPKP